MANQPWIVRDEPTRPPPVGGEPRPKTNLAAGDGLFAQLRSTLDRAAELARMLETNLGRAAAPAEGATPEERVEELEKRLAGAEADVKELAARLVESEHQAGRLMNLYVATYQLHATLEPAAVQATIAEIAINLLGAERFVLVLEREGGGGCHVALAEGLDGEAAGRFADGVYGGGDPLVDATLADGVVRFGPTAGSEAVAVVPLRVQDTVVGALIVLKLFDHRSALRPEDRDLLDLLSAHAASALFAAGLFAVKDRRLRTLESLVTLARGR